MERSTEKAPWGGALSRLRAGGAPARPRPAPGGGERGERFREGEALGGIAQGMKGLPVHPPPPIDQSEGESFANGMIHDTYPMCIVFLYTNVSIRYTFR